MKVTRLLQALVMAGFAFGCGAKVTVDSGGLGGTGASGAGGGANVNGCDVKTAASHICTSYEFTNDPTGALAAAALASCNAAGGTPGACPTASAIGTCSIGVQGVTSSETFYSDASPQITVAQAEQACAAGGGTFH